MRRPLAAVLSLTLAFATGGCQSVGQEDRVEQFLSDQYDLDSYEDATVDLNGDGIVEHIVLSTGAGYCGATGACTLVILRDDDGRLETVGRIPAVRPWVTVLPTTSNGWQDLGFVVKADPETHYHGVIEFNGEQYLKRETDRRIDWTASPPGQVLFDRASMGRSRERGAFLR